MRRIYLPLAAFLFACSSDPDENLDASVRTDASQQDGTISTDAAPQNDGGVTDLDAAQADGSTGCGDAGPCPTGTFCSRGNECRPEGEGCTTSVECGAPSVCIDGRCGEPPRFCRANDDCRSVERCAPSGVCIPRIVDDGTFRQACQENLDCGPGNVCVQGACGCTEEAACAGNMFCFFGYCFEPSECAGAEDCYPGNSCTAETCTLSTDDCTEDPNNDTWDTADELPEAASTAFSICGRDDDYYSFQLAPNVGARVVVTSETSSVTVLSRVLTRASAEAGEETNPINALDLSMPGVSIFEVASTTTTQDLLLKVGWGDVSGAYAVDFQRIPGFCAGDFFDIYGDRTAEEAFHVDADNWFILTMCEGDVDVFRINAQADDVWAVSALMDDESAMINISLDTGGMSVEGQFTAMSTEPVLSPEATAAAMWTVRSSNAGPAPIGGFVYAIDMDRQPGPRRDACAAVQNAPASRNVAVSELEELGTPACSTNLPETARDFILRIEPPRAGALVLVSARPSVTTATVALALLQTCVDDDALACGAGAVAGGVAAVEAIATSTAALYVVLSVESGDPNATIAVNVGFDVPGDYTCHVSGAVALNSSGERTVETDGTTNTVELTEDDACGTMLEAGLASGPDRFFSLSLDSGERAALELRGSQGGLLWAATDCADFTGSCAAASRTFTGQAAMIVLEPTAATNYIVAVDNLIPTIAYTYRLRTVMQPECLEDSECQAPAVGCDDYRCAEAPANDVCSGATPITLANGRATVEGSTGVAEDDFESDSGECSSMGMADVVYRVVVPAGTDELIVTITEATFDPIVLVRSADCDEASAEVACNDDPDPANDPDRVFSEVRYSGESGEGVPAGTYYIIVDAYSGAGPFTMSVELQ